MNLAEAPEGGPSHALLEQRLHPYLLGLPHALPPGLFAARPASLEALAPSPSPPGGVCAEQDEIEYAQVQQSLTSPHADAGAV